MIAAVIIKWLGHACFLITTIAGSNIVFDPFGEGMGYKVPAVKADVVFISHSHFDHNAVNVLKGSPKIIGPLEGKTYEASKVKTAKEVIAYKSILTDHDAAGGRQRGKNTVRVIEVEGVRICHLGDLGHLLTSEQVKSIGQVDILMVPVGSVYTIGGKQAKKVVAQLKPKIVIPMHFKTPDLKINLETADEFLSGWKNIERKEKLQVSKGSLPKETTVVMLKY